MDAPSWGRRWNRLARDEDLAVEPFPIVCEEIAIIEGIAAVVSVLGMYGNYRLVELLEIDIDELIAAP